MSMGLVAAGCGGAPAAAPPRPADCAAETSIPEISIPENSIPENSAPENSIPENSAPENAADLTTREGWLGRIAGQPSTVGVVVDDGRGHVAAHEADTPFPLASAAKAVHLLAYGGAVADGRVRADERVSRADWERWYVPGTDGGAHPAALARLGPGREDVTVDELVSAMVQESDNAAADWLRARLGDDALRAAAAATGWHDVDLPAYAGAVARLADPALAPAGADRTRLAVLDAQLARRVADDPAFRADVTRRVAEASRQDPARFLADNRTWAPTVSLGTPAQLVGLHRAVATGTVPGADLAARHLAWQGPTPGVGTVGFKAGSLLGVLTFGSFLRRDDGSTASAVVLGRDLPDSPPIAQQIPGQQGLAVAAMTSPRWFDRLACVA